MKNNSKKISQYSALALAVSAVIPMSCGKDSEPDDPNITFRSVSVSVTPDVVNSNKYQSVDVDANGVNDLGLASWYSNYANESRGCWLEMDGTGYTTEVLINTISGFKVAKFLDKDADINAASATWNDNYGYVSQSTNVLSVGADNADKYVGIRFEISGDTHYGWMKVKTSNSGKTLTVSEVAYDIRPDTGIKAGAK